MNCKMARELIMTDHLDGRLEPKTAAALKSHLMECKDCESTRIKVSALNADLRGSKKYEAPEGLFNKIVREINDEERHSIPARMRGLIDRLKDIWLAPRTVFAGAAAAVAVIVMVIMFYNIQERITVNEAISDAAYSLSAVTENNNGGAYEFDTDIETFLL